jgi:hypothetical protein
MNEIWTPRDVKAALIQAFEVDYLVGGRVGPKAYGNNMPTPFIEELDYKTLEFLDAREEARGGTAGQHFARMKAERRAAIAAKRKVTARQVSQMEMVLLGAKGQPSWLAGMLKGLDGARNCLTAHSVQSAFWGLRGKEFRQKQFCKRVGWSVDTFTDRRDTGASVLSFRLNKIGIECFTSTIEPEEKPIKKPEVPIQFLLLEFLAERPRTKYEFVSYAHSHGVLPERDMRSAKVIQAIGKLTAAGKITRLADGRLCRIA